MTWIFQSIVFFLFLRETLAEEIDPTYSEVNRRKRQTAATTVTAATKTNGTTG